MLHMTNGIGLYGTGYTQPKTTTKKTTTTKKKFDKDGKIVSETTTVVEESVTTYEHKDYIFTNSPTITHGTTDNKIKYGRSNTLELPLE
jgi:hypothetical protein